MIKEDQYKIEIAMSATLSAHVVEQIVKQAVQEQTDRVVKHITIAYDELKFAGFHVTFESEKTNDYKSSKEFIEQRWK